MKIRIAFLLSAVLVLACLLIFLPGKKQLGHEFEPQRVSHSDEEGEGEEDKTPTRYVKARSQYEFDMLKDPVTGTIPAGVFEAEIAFARQAPERTTYATIGGGLARTQVLNTYFPAGPNNIGGRTRAVKYDRRFNGTTNRVVIAGCVSGGIMRSEDGGNTWTLVTPSENIHNLTALAQDPRTGFEDTWYAGSGEAIGNTASAIGATFFGFGLWKSTNNGQTWTKLPNPGTNVYETWDHPFDYVYNIAVNPVNGDVYVASWVLAMKSSDGGNSFRQIFRAVAGPATSATGQTDIVISNSGRIFLAVNGGADLTARGVWYSDQGENNTFTRIAGGATLGVDSVAGWRGNSYEVVQQSGTNNIYESKRIIMALAPSNNNIGYVFYENGLSSDPVSSGGDLKPEADLFRFDMSGNTFTWSNRSANMPDFPGGNLSNSDPLSLQSGYNMEVAVKPDNPNVVFVGGTNLYRSTDGFATPNNTAWIGGYRTDFSYSQYLNSHADIHRLTFHPTDPNRAICGNDGGIQETTNILAATVAWNMLPNYQTLQVYNVAMDPGAGRNNFASGSQDNGVRFRDKTGVLGTPATDSNNHRLLFSADGAFVGISLDNNGTQYIYESIQLGRLYRARLSSPFTGGTEITPNNLTPSSAGAEDEFGEFVTNFRLEADNSDNLYYVNFNRLFRTTAASTVTRSTWTEMTGVSSAVNPGSPTNGTNIAIRGMAYSRGPYASSHVLYLGTTNGKIFRLDDPQNAPANRAPVNITPFGLTGNVQDIAVNPNNDDEVLAVVSNYNTTSIWWTKNGRSATPNWKTAEGNLTTPSVRSCMIVVKKDAANQPVTEYYVGTSVGLYSTVNLGTVLDANQQPTWQREGGQMLNYAVVQSMAYRPSDNVLLIGTHGNGMYYTNIGTPNFTPNLNTGVPQVTNDRNFIRLVAPTAAASDVQYQIGNMLGIQKVQVQLMNMKGQMVFQEQRGYQNGTIPLQRMAPGVYIINIVSADNKYRHVQKIVRL
ncbi:T9SS type A sorting domain-containing protein [Flavisolibacter sp. BT320]|nr:T9SS type A sorting domain-containing protein [Flavisolibacter longurius]